VSINAGFGHRNHRGSIVIVDYKNAPGVEEFLRNAADDGLVDYEFLVFRNACDDQTPGLTIPGCLKVEEFRSRKNLGFGAAFNRAARRATTEYILGCNADTRPSKAVLENLASKVEEDPRTIIAPILYNEYGQECGRPFYTLARALMARIPITRSWAITGRAEWVIGACFATSASFFRELHGFSRAYRLYFEDVDLCWRAWDAGGRVCVLTTEKIYHAHGRASRKVFSKPFYFHVKSAVAYFALHPRAIAGLGPVGLKERRSIRRAS
jgi:GT2 family glycosyltransferase